jgi:uncharacterized protein (DUF433 family)
MVRELGRFVVCDPEVCHGAPTIRGTRIFAVDVLHQLEEGMDWDRIVHNWDGKVSHEAIGEVIHLAAQALEERYEPAPVAV